MLRSLKGQATCSLKVCVNTKIPIIMNFHLVNDRYLEKLTLVIRSLDENWPYLKRPYSTSTSQEGFH